jgi:predicted O-methyltransferase YrrM
MWAAVNDLARLSSSPSALLSHAQLVERSLRGEGLGFLKLWLRARKTIPGWSSVRDAQLLYALAHHGPGRGAIVEIGSAWGRSTVFLATGSKRAGRERVYAVDPHTGDPWFLKGVGSPVHGLDTPKYRQTDQATFSSLEGFRHTLKDFGVDDWVIPVVATSTEAAETASTGPIRLLFIDGLHTYEAVKADVQNWVPRLIPGGIVVFDDYYNTMEGVGVQRAVNEMLAEGDVEPHLRMPHGYLVWTRKR